MINLYQTYNLYGLRKASNDNNLKFTYASNAEKSGIVNDSMDNYHMMIREDCYDLIEEKDRALFNFHPLQVNHLKIKIILKILLNTLLNVFSAYHLFYFLRSVSNFDINLYLIFKLIPTICLSIAIVASLCLITQNCINLILLHVKHTEFSPLLKEDIERQLLQSGLEINEKIINDSSIKLLKDPVDLFFEALPDLFKYIDLKCSGHTISKLFYNICIFIVDIVSKIQSAFSLIIEGVKNYYSLYCQNSENIWNNVSVICAEFCQAVKNILYNFCQELMHLASATKTSIVNSYNFCVESFHELKNELFVS